MNVTEYGVQGTLNDAPLCVPEWVAASLAGTPGYRVFTRQVQVRQEGPWREVDAPIRQGQAAE